MRSCFLAHYFKCFNVKIGTKQAGSILYAQMGQKFLNPNSCCMISNVADETDVV